MSKKTQSQLFEEEKNNALFGNIEEGPEDETDDDDEDDGDEDDSEDEDE